MTIVRWVLFILGFIFICAVSSWIYTSAQLNIARAKGVYSSPEQGMIAQAVNYYSADRQVKILSAGTNSFDDSKPFVWYVIAEIHASPA